MDFEKRVHDKEFKLNDTDDSIIQYIRENKENIHKISIQKIANDLFISPNAIMRLSRKIGYSGFSELKFSLQGETAPQEYKTVTSKMFDKIPQNIARTLDISDENNIDQAVKLMNKANKILFAGVGDSVYFCELFGRYLRCLNRKVEYFTHIHDIEYSSNQYEEGDMIVVISASGETQRLVDLARKAKFRNVTLICMTHFGENSLSKICDLQVSFWGEKRIVNHYNVTDYIGLMMTIRYICEKFWKDN